MNQTPLWWACCLGNFDCIVELMEYGANPFVAEKEQGLTPKEIAFRSNQPDVVALLEDYERGFTLLKGLFNYLSL